MTEKYSRYFTRDPYRVTVIETPEYMLMPCAPGCEGSRNETRFCTCRCRGINHGRLIYGRQQRPIPVSSSIFDMGPEVSVPESLPYPRERLPDLSTANGSTKTSQGPRPETPRGPTLKRKLGRAFLRTVNMRTRGMEEEKNEKIVKGLRYQFSQDRTDQIISQAYAIRMSKTPYANQPELYELYETGELDEASRMSGSTWVIGRPKK